MATNTKTNIDDKTVKLTSTDKDKLLNQIKQKIDEGYIPLGGFETNITQQTSQPAPGYEEHITPPPMVITPGSTTYTQLMYKPSKPVSGGGNYKKKTKTHKRKY